MFGIGFGELLLLVAIAVVVLGPQRCVATAKTLGKAWGNIQKNWAEIKTQISSAEDELRERKESSDGKNTR